MDNMKVLIEQVKNGFLVTVPGKVGIPSFGNPMGMQEQHNFIFTNWVDTATFIGRWYEEKAREKEEVLQ